MNHEYYSRIVGENTIKLCKETVKPPFFGIEHQNKNVILIPDTMIMERRLDKHCTTLF